MKIIALTNCCVDLFPDLSKVFVGGNSLNFATQCIRSGINDVSIIGAIGRDRFGDLIELHLDKWKINRHFLTRLKSPTASNRIYFDEKGDRFFKDAIWNGCAYNLFGLSKDELNYLKTRDIIAIPAGDPNLRFVLNERQKKQLVAVDFSDYFSIKFIEDVILQIDIAFLSTKENELNDLVRIAAKSKKMIVATLGPKGSVAFYNNSIFRQEAIEVDKIVDTTGCTDAFQAAYTIEWFKTRDVNTALKSGAVAASEVLSFVGGVEQTYDDPFN